MNKKQLLQWLADGQTERVLDALLAQEHLDAHIREEATLLSARFENMERQVRLGVLEADDENRERAQINAALLDLVNNSPEFSGEAAFLGKWKTKIFLGLLALVLLVILLNKTFNNPATTTQTPADTPAEKPRLPDHATEDAPGLPVAPASAPAINCKTNKGRLNVHYRAGETIRLYLTADKACHLISVLQMPDGRLLLLDDNRSITAAEAGAWLESGKGFVAAEPFGEYWMWTWAQTDPFPALNVRTAPDGSRFVTGTLEALRSRLRKRPGVIVADVQLKTHP